MTDLNWKQHTQAISVSDPGPRAFKTYCRRGKTFWRNYRRDVPGGVTLLDRIRLTCDRAGNELASRLFTQLYG